MPARNPRNVAAYHFVTLPNTGIQICRGFIVPDPASLGATAEEVWEAARRRAGASSRREVVGLIREHIACNPTLESTGWVACDRDDTAFFRLTRPGPGMALSADLVIDTHRAAGRRVKHRIDCVVRKGWFWPFARTLHLASFFVEAHAEAQAVEGSLIMDFGNSGCSFIFSETGAGSLRSRVVPVHNPFDAEYRKRTPDQLAIFRSSLIVLKVDEDPKQAPWLVMGARSEELIQNQPLATYLYAPKKYVRDWPGHLRAKAPSTLYRGVVGHRAGLHPLTHFVEQSVSHMLQLVLSSLTNPQYTAHSPKCSPQFQRVMLTYPLTWRGSDRALFARLVKEAALELVDLPEPLRSSFQVEMVCSEPVAVAAYALWETFFHFGPANLRLAAAALGNTSGTPELRLLVVDIGGGSTDIALVQVGWLARGGGDDSVDVTFKLLESMRFNRAGDRLSHIVSAAIWYFLRTKYDLADSLDFEDVDSNPVFTLPYRRQAVSELSRLAEAAKVAVSSPAGEWSLDPVDEGRVLRCFEVTGRRPAVSPEEGPRMKITRAVLRAWVEGDRQSRVTEGEPGFMDIFRYLGDLRDSLDARGRVPHLAVLSGRSTRLPFLQDLAARHLRMPLHRVRTLGQLLPDSLKGPDHENLDKLAVVRGAQRFRFGDHIRFVSLPDEPVFNRFLGTVRETPRGLELNSLLARPGDSRPRTVTLEIAPQRDVRIGHAFREDGLAEVVVNLSNTSQTRTHRVAVDLLDDHTVRAAAHDEVLFSEWVPGGTDVIVDNFNDTGRIDREPPGFIERVVRRNEGSWVIPGSIHAGHQE